MIKLIVGLGNPGSEYEKTRHNAGFMALDRFVERHRINLAWKVIKLAHAETLETGIGDQKVVLVKPLTFMNNSGQAVSSLLGKYKLTPEDLIIIYDDFDLDLGTVRVRNSGSAGGHNGVKSIISSLKTEDFVRIKLGIGNTNDTYFVDKKIPREEYVLLPFLELEKEKVNEMLNKVSLYMGLLVAEGYKLFISKHHEG